MLELRDYLAKIKCKTHTLPFNIFLVLAGTLEGGRLVMVWSEPYREFCPRHIHCPPLFTSGSKTSTHLLWAFIFIFLSVREGGRGLRRAVGRS